MNEFLNSLAERIGELLSPEVIAGSAAAWAGNLLIAAVAFLAYYALWRVVRVALVPVLRRLDVDQTGQNFFQTAAKVVILLFGTIAALSELGINTTSLVTSLGVAGLTLGFAARDTLSNVISGIFIFWDRPFVLGDLIEVDGKYGRVDRITLRSTRVVTVDGKMLAIPNSAIVNTTVASYTNFPHLRLDIPVSVGLSEDLDRVRALLLEEVSSDPDFMKKPAPDVVVTDLNDFNVSVTLRAWLADERKHLLKRFELRERAFQTLRGAGVDMPFETLRVVTDPGPASAA